IRSLAFPLGTTGAGKLAEERGVGQRIFAASVIRRRAMNYFVSNESTLQNHATRLEVELTLDPFSQRAIDYLGSLHPEIPSRLPPALKSGAEVHLQGSTASLRDLEDVGRADRTRINLLVVGSVFTILALLLRRVGLSIYLMATVIFSYLVTLGVTNLVFS